MDPIVIAVGLFVILLGSSAFFGAPYVPSRRRFLDKAFTELYMVGDKDVVVDIGSGDGIVLREAAKRGAKAIGFELNLIFVILSKILTRRFINTQIRWKNIWQTSLPKETTLVYIFSVSRDSKRMTKKLRQEVNLLGRPLNVMTFGSGLYGETPVKTLDAYQLYTLHPLQVN